MPPQQLNRIARSSAPSTAASLKYRMLMPAAVAVVQAERLRTIMRRRLAALFEDVDVIAWPTVPAPAPPLEAPVVEPPFRAKRPPTRPTSGAAPWRT